MSAPAAIGDVNPAPGPEVVAASAVGPMYVLNAHGDSVFGTVGGKDVPLLWSGGLNGQDNGRFGPNRNSDDLVASPVAFGGPAIGKLDPDATPDITAPTAGLSRLMDILAPDLQLPNDDHLMAWRGSDGNALPGFPQTTADHRVLRHPGDRRCERRRRERDDRRQRRSTRSAPMTAREPPPGWPKLTGGWLVGTPGLGDWDGNGKAEVAVVRRDGFVLVWHTRGAAVRSPSGPVLEGTT